MILDGHIHISDGELNREDFYRRLASSGIDGGVMFSISPGSFRPGGRPFTAGERLDNLFQWTQSKPGLYPFFWIDPTEEDALDQIKLANNMGVSGYKMICNHFYPGDKKAMDAYAAIAKAGKPIMFHSGILWDACASSKYNRPVEFESLIEIEGLKFSLAHISWPWCDECIAVYGMFLNAYARRPGLSTEMFIDITPGTPEIYREAVLTKMHTIGYDIENNIIFGTDCDSNNYNCSWFRNWCEKDNEIYARLGLDNKTLEKIYAGNLQRFLSLSSERVKHKPLEVAES